MPDPTKTARFHFPKLFLCLGLLGFFLGTASAQINSNRFRVNLNSFDMGPCGGANDARSIVGVLAKNNTVHNFEIAFDLPDGVTYKAGTAIITFQEGSGDFLLSEVDISDLNAPVFRLERPGDATWQVADRVRFRFDKTASCNAVVFSYNGGLFKDAHTITYDDLNGPQSASDNDPTINSYNFHRAYLAVLNYGNITANVGNLITRPVEITNSGNGNIGRLTHNVVAGSHLGSYNLLFNGSPLTPSIVSGNSYTYQIDLSQPPFLNNVGDGDTELENETIFLEETFTVDGCDHTEISHQPTWGCGSTEICQALEPVSAEVVVDQTHSNIVVSEVAPKTVSDLCGTTTYTMRVANIAGTANAYNIEINTGFSTSTGTLTSPTVNPLWGNDRPSGGKAISNFRFSAVPAVSFQPPQRPTTEFSGVGAGSYSMGIDYFTANPDGPGGLEDLDGDGFFDDMAAGDSTEFMFDMLLSTESKTCGTRTMDYLRPYYTRIEAYAQNQCDVYEPTSRVLLNYPYIRRSPNPQITGPTDIFDGQPFTLGIDARLFAAGLDPVRCNGRPLGSDDPSSRYIITLNVPNGVSLSGTPEGFSQIDPNTIEFTSTDMAYSNTARMQAEFPLVFDCSVYSGPRDISISYTTRYECECFAEDIHCDTITNLRSQCPSPCDGPVLTSFDAQRTTAGWTDDTQTTKVVLDPLVHEVDTYMARDEMVLRTAAVMNNVNPNNLYFDLYYTIPSSSAGDQDIIQFQDGSVTINDISLGSGPQTVPISSGPVQHIDGTNAYRMTFDLSSYTTAIGPTYTYGEPLVPPGPPEADEVDLELNFLFDDSFGTKTMYRLQNFRGVFYYLDGLGNRVSCNTRGDEVRYFKNRVYGQGLSVNAYSCSNTYVDVRIVMETVSPDQFPGEFRPPVTWNSTSVTLPTGIEFQNHVQTYDYPSLYTSANGGLSYSQSGNTITVTRGPNFRDWDQTSSHHGRIRFQVKGSSSVISASNTYNWDIDYDEFAYADNPQNKNPSATGTINYRGPGYTLASAQPVVSGDQNTEFFEVDLCKISTPEIPYNWLQIQNGMSFNVVGASLVAGSLSTPLNFSTAAGLTWIELDDMPSSANTCKKVRFEVQLTECSNFDFIVENAWDCNGYPSDFATANYSNPLTLRMEPKEAAVQIDILKEPIGTVDTCSDFSIGLEIRNAGDGDLIDPTVTFDIPGDATSLTLNHITLEYPRNSGEIHPLSYNLSGNTVTLDLLGHKQVAIHSGIQGSLNAASIDAQIAVVELDLSVQCNFISNTAITYEVHGDNPCGTPATGNGSRLSTNPIVVTSAEPTYDAVSNVTVPSGGLFEGCETETITIQTTIVGGPTSSLDYARIILPDGLALDPSTFVSNNPGYVVTFGSLTTVGNHEEFTVHMPDGANNGADPSYSFDLSPKNTATTCSPVTRIEVDNYVVTTALSCGSVSCGTTEISNGSTFEDVGISKPELAESSFTSNADYTADGNGNYEYHIEFGVENTGAVDISAGFVYDVYCADGTGTKVGGSLFTGTVAQPIASGNSITEDIVFNITDFCGDNGNLLVEFVPSSTNCHCDILSIPLVSEPEVIDLEVTSVVDPLNVTIGDSVTFTIDVRNNGPFDAENVRIETIVPTGYTVTGTNNDGTQAGNTITWPIFDLASSGTTTFDFTATVNTPTDTNGFDTITQVIDVDEYDNDSTPNNYNGLPLEDDESIASVHVLTADLSLAKSLGSASNTRPNVGETIRFEITIDNNGPDAANNVGIEDVVPAGFTIVAVHDGGMTAGNTIRWNRANLPLGSQVVSYEALLNTPSNSSNEYMNTAQITASDEYDPDSTPNNDDGDQSEDDEASFTVPTPTADLEIINTIAPGSANPGDTIIITIEVVNNGPYDAHNVGIENRVPSGFITTTIGNSGNQTGNTISWNALNIPNGTSLALTYEATVNVATNGSDRYLNTVQVVASDQYDGDSAPNNDDGDQSEDDEDNATLQLIMADLSLAKNLGSTSNPQPNTGDSVIFEITLTNAGPNEAQNVSVQDLVPNGYSIGTINNGGTISENAITWNLASLPVGSQVLSYEATVNAPTTVSSEYTNTAQVTSSDEYDPDSAPNNDDGDQSEDDETSFTIAPPTVDLAITKAVDESRAVVGDTLQFTVSIANQSAYDATNIGVEDILPTGFDLISTSADNGGYENAIGTWQLPSLTAGSRASIQMMVVVTETEDYTNIAQLIYLDQIDDNVSNDRAEVSIDVTRDECLTVYNEFSPNNDGANEVFFIECIENYPNNLLQVFNRWGNMVFEMDSYDNSWDGISMGRATINAQEKLPVGTYYYILDLKDGVTRTKSGWLYITR